MRALLYTIAIAIVYFAMVNLANANEKGTVSLDLNVASYHTDRCYSNCTKKYNEDNHGLGLSYALTDWLDIQGGFLTNSFDRQSRYGLLALNKDLAAGPFTVSPTLAVGAVTGYEGISKRASANGVSPVALPSVTISHKRVGLNVGYIAAGYAGKSDVVTFRVSISF